MCVDFVLAHEYCLAISLSGNIRLVSLEKWSLMASGKLCSVTKPGIMSNTPEQKKETTPQYDNSF
jgi:hypothetical protein